MSDGGFPDGKSLAQFVENQRRDLEIKEKEVALEQQKTLAASQADERMFIYAKQQLEAMERDRHDERIYKERLAKKSFWIFIVFIAAVAIFLTTAVLKDKDAMIVELLKVVAYGLPSGIGGYAVGRYKRKGGAPAPLKE